MPWSPARHFLRFDLTRSFYDEGQWFHLILRQSLWRSWINIFLPRMISLVILLVQVFSASRLLPFTGKFSSVTWFNSTTILHQATLLRVKVRLSFLLMSALAPDVTSFSASLLLATLDWVCWILLKLIFFAQLSSWLSHDDAEFCRFIGDISFLTLQPLAELDHRQSLIADVSDMGASHLDRHQHHCFR